MARVFPLGHVDERARAVEGVEVVDVGSHRAVALEAQDSAVDRIAPLRRTAGVAGGVRTSLVERVVGPAVFEDHVFDLVDVVDGIDVGRIVHAPWRDPVDVTALAVAGDDRSRVAVVAGEVGLRMPHVRVGPNRSRSRVRVHR